METKKLLFNELSLAPEIIKVLESRGFTHPTEIQERAIPVLLQNNPIDFHGQAQTGTGKTLAFGLPLLSRIDRNVRKPQALVVAPTRELALQIAESLKPFVRELGLILEPIYGGMSVDEQIHALARGAHIVVGTPGRLNDHLRRRTLSLAQIKTLVLDEADIMLDMGFKEEIDELLCAMPESREIWLFSATVKSGIDEIKKAHMKKPTVIRISPQNITTANTKQYYCVVQPRARVDAVSRFIECAPDFYGFIFCQTKVLTSEIAEKLLKRGFKVGSLHGDMSQSQRNIMMRRFRNQDISIMVATDVAARGIDVQNLTHVINLSIPEDHESYVHRIGRTGRAGKEGIAITFVTRSDLYQIRMLERKFKVRLEQLEVPSREVIIQQRAQQAASYVTTLAAKDADVHAIIATLVNSLDAEQCRKALAHIVHERYIQSILEQEEVTEVPVREFHAGRERSYKERSNHQPMQEIALSVGSDDGLTKDDIFGAITKTGLLARHQIYKVRLIKRRTFVEVAPSHAEPLITALRNVSLAGRKLRPMMVQEVR